MVRVRTISTLLYDQVRSGKTRRVDLLTTDLRQAVEIARRIYLGESERPYGAARGPPGVGKTAVAEAVMTDEKIEETLQETNSVFLYEAPTNDLVLSAFERLLSLTVYDCDTAREFLRSVRLYGSLLPPPYISEDDGFIKDCNIEPTLLREVVGGKITEDIKFVFSTEFQRVSARLKNKRTFYLFIDEASTSPFYLPYTPLSDIALKNLMEEKRGVINALFVVGDENQAIGLEDEYRHGMDLLVLPKIFKLLSHEDSLETHFKHIGVTLRLPKPTEEPLDRGFYADLGGLKAHYTFNDRFKELQLDTWKERWEKCREVASLPHKVNILLVVEKMLSSPLPLAVFNIKESYDPGERVEPYRVKVAIGLAALFQCLYPRLDIAVVGPYQDLVLTAKANYYSRYGVTRDERMRHVRFLTIHQMLGREADIVIAVLGKERHGEEKRPTIYFQEPNLLNVQFSRHKAMLVVVGNATRLRNVAADIAKKQGLKGRRRAKGAASIRATIDRLLELVGVSKPRNVPLHSEGGAGVFLKMET